MTLLVYKDGQLAADSLCSRNSTIENAGNKIRVFDLETCHLTLACAGQIDAINYLVRYIRRNVKTATDLEQLKTGQDFKMRVCGIAVVTYRDRRQYKYSFNYYPESTGRGAWIDEAHNTFLTEGADEACVAAIAMNHVNKNLTAADIIEKVSELNTDVSVRFGIHTVHTDVYPPEEVMTK